MAELTTIAGVLLPIFALIGLGRGVVRFGLLDPAGTRGLIALVFWFVLPSLLFLSVAGNPLPSGVRVAGLYFAVALVLFGLSFGIGRLAVGLGTAEAAIFALNAVFGNTLLLGVPIVGAVWGGDGLPVLLSIIAAHSLVLLPVASVLVESGSGRRGGSFPAVLAGPVVGTLRNPIIASILAAFLWRAGGLALPGPVRHLLELLGQAAPALALICLGASLPATRRAGLGPEVLVAIAIKLAVMPLAMLAAVRLAEVPSPAGAIMVVTAGLPTGANAFLLARRSDAMIEASAATVLLATAAAAVTLGSLLVWLR